MKRYAYAWLTGLFFFVSIVGHWIFGWFTFVDEQQALHQAPTFSGAELKWTVPPLEFLEEVVEEDDGRVSFEPLGYGPFHGSVLTGAVFRGCAFHRADFRGAEDLRGADFAGASGLDDAYFDNPEDRAHMLAAARTPA